VRKPAVVTVLVLAVAGCSERPPPPPPPPTIDFTADAENVTAKPFMYCDISVTDCKRDNAAQVELTVAPGTAVRVTVPDEVAETPWSVVIQYVTAAGEQKDPETVAAFAPNGATTFDALPPGPGDQLQTVEVKQAGAKLMADETGQQEPVARGVWSVSVKAPA